MHLHQNYLEFYETLEDVVEASHYFSNADFLAHDWTVSWVLLLLSIVKITETCIDFLYEGPTNYHQ